MKAALPIRVFIGSSARNRIEERVFVQSLRDHARHPLEIHVIDGVAGTVTLDSGETLPAPGQVPDDLRGVTAFSMGRFSIPHWCGQRGRAIYCDSDQLVFADIAELWDHDLGGAAVAAVHVRDAISAPAYVDHMLTELRKSDDDLYLTSVMLMDCEKLGAWQLDSIVAALRRKELDYVQTLFLSREFRAAFGTTVARLPPTWNSLDVWTPDTKLLHFTDLSSQPWRFPHNPAAEVWDREFLRALRDGLISREELQQVRATGFISRRVQRILDVPEQIRESVNRGWRLGERVGHDAKRIAGRAVRAAAPPARVARRVARRAYSSVEEKVIPGVACDLQKLSPRRERIATLGKVLASRLGTGVPVRHEVTFFVYSAACERMLVPVALAMAQERREHGRINVVAVRPIAEEARARLVRAGCHVEREALSLVRAWEEPAHKVVVLCLDHRMHYVHHKLGVDVADSLRLRGVKTMCMQHGGCRGDSVASLASSASERLLVWGEATRRMLVQSHGVDRERIVVVGNPLHDGVRELDRGRVLAELAERRPGLRAGRDGRKIVVMATTLQREYSSYRDEHERYVRYVKHVYAGLDYSRTILIVKAHPCDPTGAGNLYEQLRSCAADPESVLLIAAEDRALDVYSLMSVADLVLTRCSTVAEEALLVGKKVVAFDLEPDGLSQYYRHLERFGDYRTVYEAPPDAFARTVFDALFSESPAKAVSRQEMESEITLALDGQSASRAAAAVWHEVDSQRGSTLGRDAGMQR
jgi:hypothetical protein